MPKFYMVIAPEIFFRFFLGGEAPATHLLRLWKGEISRMFVSKP